MTLPAASSMMPPVIALLLALLAGSPDTLVVGILADPVSLDPHRATDLVSAAILSNVCEPLVRYRADGRRPEPALARTWATGDRRHWTLTLRPGVSFHDGATLDADAVVANLANLARERSLRLRARRLGPDVVGIDLDRPNAALVATLSQPLFCMVSPRALRHPGPRVPVGTGPFRWVRGDNGLWELHANSSYWGGPPRLRRIVFRRMESDAELADALTAGEIDLTSALGHEQVRRLEPHAHIAIHTQTGLNLAFLSFNSERPPLHDRRVRHAIARAIDRPALVAEVLGGRGEPARNPLPPSVWGYGAHTKELVTDLPLARRLLREAGLANGFAAVLLVADVPRPYNPAPLEMASRLVKDLARVGVRLRVESVPTWREFLARATRGDYQMAVMGWQADTTDPNDFLSALLASDAIGATNRSRYRSAAMDTLLEHGRRGSDQQQRAATYAELQALFQKDMPWAPLWHVSVFTARRRNVHGLTLGVTGTSRLEKAWKTP